MTKFTKNKIIIILGILIIVVSYKLAMLFVAFDNDQTLEDLKADYISWPFVVLPMTGLIIFIGLFLIAIGKRNLIRLKNK